MHDSSTPEISVVLPGYNERAALEAAVNAYRSTFERDGINFELLVIDDASTDGMGPLADQLAADDGRVRVFHHACNRGQVAGILRGFREARGRYVTHNGMDLPFHPDDTAKPMALLRGGADVVVVERSGRNAYGMTRKILSWGNTALLRVLLGSPFTDHNFVQFFRRDVVAALPVQTSGVSTVTPELILRARHAGYRVVSLPADYHRRQTGRSTVTVAKVARSARELFRLWQALRRPPAPAPKPPHQAAAGACDVAI
jgi:dolichol-phosphate mannosyltransferase